MYTCPIQMNDVRYNAASQSFEATITVHDNSTIRSYACALEAPISMSFEEAATRLSKQAIHNHQERGGLFSETKLFKTQKSSARLSPAGWLQNLLHVPGREAA